jgi:hypothetical protein
MELAYRNTTLQQLNKIITLDQVVYIRLQR